MIELKIWRGNEYNKRGEKQLAEYLEYYHLEKGYLLSFNFNKNKKTGLKEVEVDNKKIIEVFKIPDITHHIYKKRGTYNGYVVLDEDLLLFIG